MKHPMPVAIVLVTMFLVAQFIGMFVIRAYIDEEASEEKGAPVYEDLPEIGPFQIERPEIEADFSFVYMGIAVIIGTLLLLFLMRLGAVSLWKFWFFTAIIITLTMAISAFIPALAALPISAIASFFRVIRPNVIVHNLSELFVYGGLAAIFVPILNIRSAFILLAIIAAYDFFAVFKSRHMISLAKFQAENKMFAGLFVPKQLSVKSAVGPIKQVEPTREKYADTGSYAVIGGGDIGFPLLFAGAAIPVLGFSKALLLPLFAAAGLVFLLIISKKGKFYPAMPFIAAGCFVGFGILRLI